MNLFSVCYFWHFFADVRLSFPTLLGQHSSWCINDKLSFYFSNICYIPDCALFRFKTSNVLEWGYPWISLYVFECSKSICRCQVAKQKSNWPPTEGMHAIQTDATSRVKLFYRPNEILIARLEIMTLILLIVIFQSTRMNSLG